jgi:glycosyl transferase family 25
MNQFDKIFVINLKRNPDRKEFMSQLMAKHNLSFEFIEAIDGAEMFSTEDKRLKFVENNFLDCNGWKPSRGQLGCWLSHIKIWKKIVAEDINSCLIIEDDVDFRSPNENKSFVENFDDYYNSLPSDWNIFMMGYMGSSIKTINEKITQLHHPSGTHGYALKNEAAKILLKHYWPMRGALDSFTGHIFFAGNSTAEAKKSFEDNWNKDRCNNTSLYNSEADMSLVTKLKGYASSVSLINQGSSNYSTT